MLRHVSVQADEPQRIAHVIAELWGGASFPYPVAADDAWMAVVDDGRGSMIEVLPRGTELRAGCGDEDAIGVTGPSYHFCANHVAMDTVLDEARVFAIGQREGWPMKYGLRAGGAFRVIEVWVEGCTMFELVPPSAQRGYADTLTVAKCRAMLEPAGQERLTTPARQAVRRA